MQKSKLTRLLSLFSQKEMEQMLLFSKSPYFNTNRQLASLLQFLAAYAPDFEGAEVAPEKAYAFVYGKTTTPAEAKSVITKLASKLLKLCEQFIEHQVLKSERFYGAYFRKKWHQKPQNLAWEEETLRDMNVALATYPLRDAYKAHGDYLLEYEWAKWNINAGNALEHLDLNKMNRALDVYYLRAKLECLCHLNNHKLVSAHIYDMDEYSAVQSLLALRRDKMDDAYLIWEKALLLLQEPQSETRYQALKQSQKAHGAYLSPGENRTIFLYLAHSSRLVYKEAQVYFSALMDLYKMQIKSGCLLVEGVLPPITFYNIITVAISLQNLDWAGDFYKTYASKLDPHADNSSSIRYLCNSMLHFENQQFTTALEMLNQAHFRDVQGKLTERRFRLQIYLELGYNETFSDQVNSFRKFLYVNKAIIPPHHYDSNIAFIQATLSLFKVKHSGRKWLGELLGHLERNPNLPGKKWLEKHLRTFG